MAAAALPEPVNPDYDAFNRTAKALLRHLHRKYPKDEMVLRGYNALGIAAQASPQVPAVKYFNQVWTTKVKLPPPSAEERSILDLIRGGSPDVFCQPAVVAQFEMLAKSEFAERVEKASHTLKQFVWQKVQQLTKFSGHPLEAPASGAAAQKDENTRHFNQAYRAALDEFCVAFPCDNAAELLARFDAEAQSGSTRCMDEFRRVACTDLVAAMRNPEALCQSPDLFTKLPFFQELPLEKYWQESIASSAENQDRLADNLYALLMAGTGLRHVNAQLMDGLMQQTQEAAGEMSTGDSSEIKQAAMALLTRMQQNRSLQGLQEEVQSKMPLMDSEMLRALVGAVCPEELSSMQSALAGVLQGSTGAPAFGDDAPHPAWMKKK